MSEVKEQPPIRINGKSYPLWSQFVQNLEWIGGTLQDLDPDSGSATGKIVSITLTPNGTDSAFFNVDTAEGWGCGSDVRHLGVDCRPGLEPGWIHFVGYGGHRWRIRRSETQSHCE